VTYRWRGHVGPKEDVDVGVRRRPEELVAWKKRDPVRRLADALNARNALNGGVEAITTAERKACEAALTEARKAPYPPAENLLGLVYKDRAP
jgi:pyruvate dehydrogenase E1 component alpha subunit